MIVVKMTMAYYLLRSIKQLPKQEDTRLAEKNTLLSSRISTAILSLFLKPEQMVGLLEKQTQPNLNFVLLFFMGRMNRDLTILLTRLMSIHTQLRLLDVPDKTRNRILSNLSMVEHQVAKMSSDTIEFLRKNTQE